ncbi:hypothetical protein AMTRI_Chr10g3200 [Amborella trichopoda]
MERQSFGGLHRVSGLPAFCSNFWNGWWRFDHLPKFAEAPFHSLSSLLSIYPYSPSLSTPLSSLFPPHLQPTPTSLFKLQISPREYHTTLRAFSPIIARYSFFLSLSPISQFCSNFTSLSHGFSLYFLKLLGSLSFYT